MQTLKISFLVFILQIIMSAQWEWKNPLPQSNSLKKIFFTDSSTGWMVGDRGTFVRKTDGSELKAFYYDSVTANLKSLTFINKNLGWAVSAVGGMFEEGRVFKTSDAGQSWTQVYLFNKILYDVKFISEDIGWVVGFGIISKTTNGGISWNDQLLDPAAKFYSCFFADSLRGWAVGYLGTEVYHTEDGGLIWVQQNLDSAATYFSISFADSMNGWIAGNSVSNSASIFRSTNGGNNWFEYSLANPGLTSVTFINDTIGWISDRVGNVLKTSDGGNTWLIASSLGTYINHIFFTDTKKGWLVHSNDVIRKTIDGGLTWISQSSGFRFNIESAFFIDSLKGIIIQPSGTLLYTQDGAKTWTVSHAPPYADYVHNITFVDSLYGYACGYRHNPYPTLPGPLILKTTTGGQTWSGFQPPDFGLGTHLYAIEFINRQTGFTGTNVIWKTTNGGWNWNIVCTNTGTIFDIFFINQEIGWASAENGNFFKTTNAGDNWDLIGSGQDTVIYSIYFLDENIGWVGGWGGLFMNTTDGGYTWQKHSYGQWPISCIQFTDENNGWAVGGNRLKTTNGGQTWEGLWIPTEYNINNVQFVNGRFGWFTGDNGVILKYLEDEPTAIEIQEYEYKILTYILSQNYPNPFNPVTKIKYTIPQAVYPLPGGARGGLVTLKVYDILGKEVATLVNEAKPAGEYEAEFNATNLPSGIYFYQLKVYPANGGAVQYSETRKMVLLK